MFAGIGQHTGIGGDQGIHAQLGGVIHCALPALPAAWLGIGIDRHIEFATFLADQLKAGLQLLLVQVEASEVASVGVIAETNIDGIGALADGCLERRQAACWTNQLHGFPSGTKHSRAL